MKILLGYLIPPLIGAVIGYVTNAVAIRMLFRPLKEIRLFARRGGAGDTASKTGRGIRLPFTPGILPRQRHKLADSIGRMVERELLTPRIIRERLRSDSVGQGVARSVSRFTEKLLRTTMGSLHSSLERRAAELPGEAPAADSGGRRFLAEILRDFSRSPVLAGLLDSLLVSLLEAVLRGPDAGTEKAGTPLMDLSIPDILGGERTAALREKQEALIRKTLNRKMAGLPFKLGPLFFDLYPEAVSGFLKLLDRPDIRRGLEIQGRIFLDNAIQKLSAVQRFFISAGQYDRTLSERMPEIVDDLIGQLRKLLVDNAVRKRAADYLSDTAFSLAAEPVNYNRLVQLISDTLFSLAEQPLGESLSGLGINGVPELVAGIRRFFTKERADGEGGGVSAEGGGPAGAALSALKVFFAEHAAMTVGEFFSIDEEKKRRIDDAILEKLFLFADSQAESVLKTINIRAMVTERIDSLDMLRVERIVLDVMANQLKWINFFGAILGALIGGAEVVVSALIR
ncbi:MAG: DUF445 family protein [Spirochaetaceae bacterium]|jgi:uncharacterized membrane-anchored protein YjiN (DUF445 family)|nr:DUF445 family protein [Spirochaetaceae bacterium]